MLLGHQFVTRYRSPNVLMDLIQRTKAAVRDLDNLNYRKMKKILMVDNCETESTIGDADDTADEQAGGDSSKSNSVTSEQSVHSAGVSASSQSSSTNSLPAGKTIAANAQRNTKLLHVFNVFRGGGWRFAKTARFDEPRCCSSRSRSRYQQFCHHSNNQHCYQTTKRTYAGRFSKTICFCFFFVCFETNTIETTSKTVA